MAPDEPFAIDDLTTYESTCGSLSTGRAIVTFKGGWSDSTVYFNLDGSGWTRVTGSSLLLTGLSVAEHHLEVAQNQSKACTDDITFEIRQAAMEVTIASALAPTCSDNTNGEVVLVASALNPQFTRVGTTETNTIGVFTELTYGVHQFVVQDLSNTLCVSDTIDVAFTECDDDTEDVEIQSITVLQESACVDSEDGEAYVSVRGGLPPYQYYLGGVLASENLENLPVGTYEVVVEDALQKRDTATFSIDTLSSLSLENIVTTKASCAGVCDASVDAMVISGGSGYYRVEWNDGDTGDTRSDLCPGTYSYTIYDEQNNGCSLSGHVVIEQYESLTLSVTEMETPTCNGDSDGTLAVQASGGSNSFQYVWEHGATGRRLTALSAGDYIVHVTDQVLGCSLSDTLTLNEGQTITVSDTILTPPSCEGGSNGSIQLVLTNVTTPFVEWSNGAKGSTISALSAGVYSYTVTSIYGCETSGTITLEDRPPLSAEVSVVNNTCYGQCSGRINLAISGGQSPYYVEWTSGSRSASLSGLCNGSYTYTITDQLGCEISDVIVIESPDPVAVTLTEEIAVSCFGAANGLLGVAVTGGNGGYSYAWSNGATDSLVSDLAAGIYTLVVSDSSGCSATQSYTITQPDVLYTYGDQSIDPSCSGFEDGEILVYPQGGTSPYTYAWSNGSATQNLSGLASGSYQLTLTDDNGCIYEKAYTLTNPESMYLANVSYEDPVCHDEPSGLITLDVLGGTAPLSYLWSSGETSASISEVTPGDHELTVTDAQGCILEATFTLANPDVPAIYGLDDYMVMCDGGTILLQTEGEWKSYYWEGPDNTFSTESTWEINEEGDYHVTVTDDDDCPAEKSMYLEISENALTADFIRISEAYTFESIVFVDLSLPTPDTVTWVLPETDAIVVNDMDELSMELVFTEVGEYTIGIEATYGTCLSESFKVVTIEDGSAARQGTTQEAARITTSIYPNPTKDKLNILINSPERETMKLQLMNMSRNVVYQQEVEGSKDYLVDWELSHLNAGVYILIVQQGELIQTKRILIVR